MAIGDTYGLRPGQLEVTKTIAGAAAGQQGQVVIHTVCNGVALTPDLVVPAGTPRGCPSRRCTHLAATPATCVVTETANGATSSVVVDVVGSPRTTTIEPGDAGAVNITDTYSFAAGSLLVRKTIAGPGAGQQGEVTIHSECAGTALTPDFVIPAGTPAGDQTQAIRQHPGRIRVHRHRDC